MCQANLSQIKAGVSQHLHRLLAPVHEAQKEPSHGGEQLMTRSQGLLLHGKTSIQRQNQPVITSRDKISTLLPALEPATIKKVSAIILPPAGISLSHV